MPTKPHLRIDDVEPIRAGRLSGLPTASEVARKRALQKLGLNLDWYNARLDGLRDVNGDACCESCGNPESKRKPGGAIKDLVVTKSKTLVCSGCADKIYKAAQKAKVDSRNDRNGADSAEQWWKRNRAKLTEAERIQHENREGDVVFLIQALKEHLKGEGWDAEGLPETIREFCEEVSTKGTLDFTYTLVPGWWKDEERDKYALALGGAFATYYRYGYFAALPLHLVHDFFKFAEEHLHVSTNYPYDFRKRTAQILAVLDGKEYVDPDLIVTCSTFGCKATKVRGLYEILPPQWFCPSCQAHRDKQGREASSKIANQQLNDSRADRGVTHDKWGRQKDQIFGDGGPFNP